MDASAPKQEGNERDACGCLNYYVQLFILCCLEIGACICLYLGQQAEFGTLDQEPGGSLSWGHPYKPKASGQKIGQRLSNIETRRQRLGLVILATTSIYLGAVFLCTLTLSLTFSSRRASVTQKMSDYPGVVVASLIYVFTVTCALVLSAWLGIGVYFWPGVALKTLGFSFKDYSKGVYFLCAAACIVLLAFLWRSVAWCGRRYKRATNVEAPLAAKLP